MINITKKEYCCGCESCVQICPKRCISFLEDTEGFSYPKVDISRCINCGLCEKVCPIINVKESEFPIKVFAAKNKNKDIQRDSSSGGVFDFLARQVLSSGGVVFGAKYDEHLNVCHDYVENEEDLKLLRSSKYVESKIGETFINVKKILKEGRIVLFCGTPCQVSGLLNFLQKKYENLITVDFICHGIPSSKVWRKYLLNKQKVKGNLLNVNFRDKKEGWLNFSICYTYQNGVVEHVNKSDDLYYSGFISDIFLRPSCYKCKFKKFRNGSNFTIADYWGIEKFYPEFYDFNGVSALIMHRNSMYIDLKGLDKIETKLTEVSISNTALIHSHYKPIKRSRFFKDIDNIDIESNIKKNKQLYKIELYFLFLKRIYRYIIRKWKEKK